tara:strand:- start:39 stop:632 length:594 start_codon:yes stop_codon:yes gene_type:complete
MEFLIDRKFWNKVIKKLPATSGAWIKRNLSEWHTKVETKYVKKKVENPHYMPRFGKSSPWDEPKYFVRDVPKSKTIKVGKYLKTDFVLNLPKTKIREGFFDSIDAWVEKDAWEEDKSKEGHVYLIQDIRSGLYKIGITKNMEQRMKQLGVGDTAKLIDDIFVPDAKDREKQLHKKYKDARLPQTEYFNIGYQPSLDL